MSGRPEVGLCAMLRLREQVTERYQSVGGDVELVFGSRRKAKPALATEVCPWIRNVPARAFDRVGRVLLRLRVRGWLRLLRRGRYTTVRSDGKGIAPLVAEWVLRSALPAELPTPLVHGVAELAFLIASFALPACFRVTGSAGVAVVRRTFLLVDGVLVTAEGADRVGLGKLWNDSPGKQCQDALPQPFVLVDGGKLVRIFLEAPPKHQAKEQDAHDDVGQAPWDLGQDDIRDCREDEDEEDVGLEADKVGH